MIDKSISIENVLEITIYISCIMKLASFPGSTPQLFSQRVRKAGEWSLGTRLNEAILEVLLSVRSITD